MVNTQILCTMVPTLLNKKFLSFAKGKVNLLRLNKHLEGQKYLNESSGMIEFGEKDFKID